MEGPTAEVWQSVSGHVSDIFSHVEYKVAWLSARHRAAVLVPCAHLSLLSLVVRKALWRRIVTVDSARA